ncbi:MAG TPA: DUF4139 domain-containing protein [Polyangia bacterium]
MTEPRRLEAPSTVARVTFFEDRAEVERVATCRVEPGVTLVVVPGVTVVLDDTSLVARVRGTGARVLAARAVRRVRELPELSAAEVAAVEADLKRATQRRARAERQVSRREAARERLAGLIERWAVAVRRAPRGGPAAAGCQAAYATVDSALGETLAALGRDRGELLLAREDEERARLRLAAGRRLHPRYEATLELQVEAAAAGEVELRMSYRAPCALWRPEHLARLTRADGLEELELTTIATAWQATGEEWRDVPVRFSTARPAQADAPPLITDDVLVLRRKSDEERQRVVVEARDQVIAVTGAAGGVRRVDEMPGVDDGGEPQWFAPARPATIPSDGHPMRVAIGAARLPCTVEVVAYPERSLAAYVRATATLQGPAPLLAGPVRVGRGREICGTATLPFVGPGEPFELSLGADDALRVRRRVDEKRETTALTGTQKVTRTVSLFVSNLGSDARDLTLKERVPVSEIEDVQIALVDRGGAEHDARDGFLRFAVAVPGNATRELAYAYRIEAAAKVVLPF